MSGDVPSRVLYEENDLHQELAALCVECERASVHALHRAVVNHDLPLIKSQPNKQDQSLSAGTGDRQNLEASARRLLPDQVGGGVSHCL